MGHADGVWHPLSGRGVTRGEFKVQDREARRGKDEPLVYIVSYLESGDYACVIRLPFSFFLLH